MVTQKDVAELAGVSFITVSRVINGLGNVKDETRTRVEAAIRQLNYHPNRLAQALNNGFTHTLALVTPRMHDRTLFNNYYIISLLSGIETMCRTRGWDVLLTTDFDLDGDFDFLRVWHQRKVDGLVFVGLNRFPEKQLLAVESAQIPCVSISDRLKSPAISWVDTDSQGGGKEAVRRLIELGHRRLIFLGIDTTREFNPNFIDREMAVREAVKEAQSQGLAVSLQVLPSPNSLPYSGTTMARTYITLDPLPTGVIAANDSIAFAFLEETVRHGLACPRDFSIIGFDAEPQGRTMTPTLASFSQPLEAMGKTAVTVLLDRLCLISTAKQERIFPLQFVAGSSLGSCPVSGASGS